MKRQSIGKIEAVRGFAALLVVAGHMSAHYGVLHPVSILAKVGQEAVMAFFLISGFVIFYAMNRSSDHRFGAYFRKRWTRIYPIFLLALVLSGVLAGDGRLSLRTLVGNLLLLQDAESLKPGVWFGTFGGNTALWSLSYEWWFYLMFYPLWRYVPERLQAPLVAMASASAAAIYALTPNQPCLFIAYFAIWWTGVEAARAYVRKQAIPIAGLLPLALTGLAFAPPVVRAVLNGAHLGIGVYPMLPLRHVLSAAAILAAALLWRRLGWTGFDRTVGRFTVVAPFSYAIYAVHYPVITTPYLAWLPETGQIAAAILIILAFSYFAERPYQEAANRVVALLTRRQLAPERLRAPT